MDTFEKLEYRIKAGIREAKDEKTRRLSDRVKLPLKGLHPSTHIVKQSHVRLEGIVTNEQLNSCP